VFLAATLFEPVDWAVSAYEIARALAEGNPDEAALIFALAVTPVAGYSLYQSGIFDQAGNIIRRLGDEADTLGRQIGSGW
jgi:propanediol dehydratase large subunit